MKVSERGKCMLVEWSPRSHVFTHTPISDMKSWRPREGGMQPVSHTSSLIHSSLSPHLLVPGPMPSITLT